MTRLADYKTVPLKFQLVDLPTVALLPIGSPWMVSVEQDRGVPVMHGSRVVHEPDFRFVLEPHIGKVGAKSCNELKEVETADSIDSPRQFISHRWELVRKIWDLFDSIKEPQELREFLEKYGPIERSQGRPFRRWSVEIRDTAGSPEPGEAWQTEGPVPRPLLLRASSQKNSFIRWSEFKAVREGFELEFLNENDNPAPPNIHNFVWNQPLEMHMQFDPWGLGSSPTPVPLNFTLVRTKDVLRSHDREVTQAFRSQRLPIPQNPGPTLQSDDPDEIHLAIWGYISTIPDVILQSKIWNKLQGDAKELGSIRGPSRWVRVDRSQEKTTFVSCSDVAEAVRACLILSRVAGSRWHRCQFRDSRTQLLECRKVFEQDSAQVTRFCCAAHGREQNKRDYIEKRKSAGSKAKKR